ncbi:hypothetical protein CAPTEDRAFT_122836, partial [Capitella teleta]
AGATWMGEILRLMWERQPHFPPKSNAALIPYARMAAPGVPGAIDCTDGTAEPRIVKTHLDYEFFQRKVEQEGLRVVVVLREPKDALTSHYFLYWQKMIGFTGDFNQFFEIVHRDKVVCGNICKISKDLWAKRHLANVHVDKYEEMKKTALQSFGGSVSSSRFLLTLKPLGALRRTVASIRCGGGSDG